MFFAEIAGPLAAFGIIIGLPWMILHYITKWKTAATLTTDDEQMLEELHRIARRLDERMDTVERLVASDNPEFKPARLIADSAEDNAQLDEIDRLLTRTRKRTAK
jgi:phage shock protein B